MAAAALPAVAQPTGFHLIPNILVDGTRNVRASGLSADGTTVIGTVMRATLNEPEFGFVYRVDGLRIDFGQLPGVGDQAREIGPGGVSFDGTYVVGYRGNGDNAGSVFRLNTRTLQVDEVGTLPRYETVLAVGVSADGATIVGDAANEILQDYDRQAVKWTLDGGPQGLGWLRPTDVASSARAISADGSVIVGRSWDPTFNVGVAFRYTEANGMQELPSLPPTAYGPESLAWAISPNGEFIAGISYTADLLGTHAVLWDDSGIVDLGMFPGGRGIGSFGVSDGGVVVGAGSALLDSGLTNIGFVWDRSSGLQYIGDYLAANGLAIPEGSLIIECSAISADGRTFLGTGTSPALGRFNFVATVPGPTTSSLFALLLAGRLSRRRSRQTVQLVRV